MQNFAQQLILARKKKNMTQEQLASEINISRSAIGHWELGHSLPDIETIQKLSIVLEYNFFAPEIPVDDAALEMEFQEVHQARTKKRITKEMVISFLAGAVFMAIVSIVLFLALPQKAADTPMLPEYPTYSMEWYQQEVAPQNGKAHVEITPEQNPTYAIRMADFPDGVGWFYTFLIQETNGISFKVTEMMMDIFDPMGNRYTHTYGPDILLEVWKTDTLERGHVMSWNGGMPLQQVSGVGMLVRGVDANGNEMEFHGYLELSKQIVGE